MVTKQTAMRAAGRRHSSRNATLHVESAYCRRQNAFIVGYVMKRHFVESTLEDFAVAWKVWLSQNTYELSDNEQENVDCAASEVYCLGGAKAPETQLD